MRKLFSVVLASGCLTLAGCTIGVPLWPLMLVEQPAATNAVPVVVGPVPLILPAATDRVAHR